MKVSRETKARISTIKEEVSRHKSELATYLARLEEHSGTKRVCRGLAKVIAQIDEWQRQPH